MPTIGLDKLYYAKITEDDEGNEEYGTPQILAKAMKADISVELAEATLYADDAVAEIVKEFKNAKLTLGIDRLSTQVIQDLTGARLDNNKVIVSAGEDSGSNVAVGFRSKKSNGKYVYFWFYRVKFGFPSASMETKGDSVSFQTPSIEGTVMPRNKPDAQGRRPWRVMVEEDDEGVADSVISGWYQSVYDPSFSVQEASRE